MNLERLTQLRNTAQGVLNRHDGDLGFDSWDCSAYACLLGHYNRDNGYPVYTGFETLSETYGTAALHFGITRQQAKKLFRGARVFSKAAKPSPEAYVELEQRIKLIDKLILEATPVIIEPIVAEPKIIPAITSLRVATAQ